MSTAAGNATLVSQPSSYPPPEAEYTEIHQNPQLFLEKLRKFHSSLGSTVKIPTVGGGPLDLHRLFVEVTTRGGMEKVTKNRKWTEVFNALNSPSKITGGSFILKRYYQSLLQNFEEIYYFRKNAPSVVSTDSAGTLGSSAQNLLEDNNTLRYHHSASFTVKPGTLLTGTVDEITDDGYSVTVDIGHEKWQGIIYHVPSESEPDGTLVDPSPNEVPADPTMFSDSSGYKHFEAEMYEKLKPFYGNEEEAMKKKISLIWSSLSEAEKEIYLNKG